MVDNELLPKLKIVPLRPTAYEQAGRLNHRIGTLRAQHFCSEFELRLVVEDHLLTKALAIGTRIRG